jgi:hypothetical protein
LDGTAFDFVARRRFQAASRRSVLRSVAASVGVAFGLSGSIASEEAMARKRNHKPKKPRKRCGAGGACRVIVSSTVFGGKIGGLAGADFLCQDLAESAGLPGTYKAWLSDSTASPSTRFVRSKGPYVLVNGKRIADNWQDLTDGSLDIPINVTQTGSKAADSTSVWTYTKADGTAIDANTNTCGNWAAATGDGDVGSDTSRNATWTDNGAAACNTGQHLYCFQQS